MAARTQLPGMRWFLWLRNPALRIGVLTGIYLSCTFIAWLLAANHITSSKPFAGVRNLIAGRGHDFPDGDSGLALPAGTRENVCFRPGRMDTVNVHLSRSGNALHAARKPHGSTATVYVLARFPTHPWPRSPGYFSCARRRATGTSLKCIRRMSPATEPAPVNLSHPTKRKKDLMKLCRFQPQTVPSEKLGSAMHPEVLQGVISGETVREVSGDILGKWTVADRSWPLSDVKLLPPVNPSKIVAVGRNYADHAAEFNNPAPEQPIIFLKPPSSLLPPEDAIVLVPNVNRTDFEGELAVVIGRQCSQLPDGADLKPYIAGYTCLNDVSARDYQQIDKQWTRAKAFDTFCPMGPVLETEFDWAHRNAGDAAEWRSETVRPVHGYALPG